MILCFKAKTVFHISINIWSSLKKDLCDLKLQIKVKHLCKAESESKKKNCHLNYIIITFCINV